MGKTFENLSVADNLYVIEIDRDTARYTVHTCPIRGIRKSDIDYYLVHINTTVELKKHGTHNLDSKLIVKTYASCKIDLGKIEIFVGTSLEEVSRLAVYELRNSITAYERIIYDIESKL